MFADVTVVPCVDCERLAGLDMAALFFRRKMCEFGTREARADGGSWLLRVASSFDRGLEACSSLSFVK